MKEYQIKIVVKKTKPPVWRRCMIPCGITFAQLSVILSTLNGRDVSDFYEFEFYQRGQQLRENNGKIPFRPNWKYDLLDASETFIDEFLEQEEWFTYRIGNDCEYRVEIEAVKMDGNGYPMLLKYKGESPEAVSIGNPDEINCELKRKFAVTYGKGEFLSQKELYQRLEKKQYGLCASVNSKNDKSKIRKSTDSMMKELAEQLTRHIMGVAEKHMNSDGKPVHSKKMEAEMRQAMDDCETEMKQAIVKHLNLDTMPELDNTRIPKHGNVLLKDVLACWPRETLNDEAKTFGVRRISSYKKRELAERIANELLAPSMMRSRMSMLTDEQIGLFEKIMDCEYLYLEEETEEEDAYVLCKLGYVAADKKNYLEVPADVAAAYRKISTPQFHESRKKLVWMKKCLDILVILYAVAPVRVLQRLYRRSPELKEDREELLSIFDSLPAEQNPCVRIGDKIIYREVMRDRLYQRIETRQGDHKFYIPTRSEIEDFYINSYFAAESSYQRLGEFLMDTFDMYPEEADYMLYDIFQKMAMGADFHEIMDDINEQGMIFPNEKSIHEFCGIMMDVNNNTRMMELRGHKPCEIAGTDFHNMMPGGKLQTIVPGSTMVANMLRGSQAELEKMGFGLDFDFGSKEIPVKILPNGMDGQVQSGTRKIYPNDPCPCGSGKKYKKCCGRG